MDDLNSRPREILREIFSFVGVNPDEAERIELTRENKGTDYRFAGAQRVALSLNKIGERFWRSHPKLKRLLRRMYYALNGKMFEKDTDPATLDAMHKFYEPCNVRFAEQLRTAGYDNLPGWLTDKPAGAAR